MNRINKENKLIFINKESEFSYDALKSHPFFKGIDFNNLKDQEAPDIELPKDRAEKMKELGKGFDKIAIDSIENQTNEESRMSDIDDNEINPSSNFSQGKVLLTGLVQKRCGWVFYKPRQLILKDTLKIFYFDAQTNELKVKFFYKFIFIFFFY